MSTVVSLLFFFYWCSFNIWAKHFGYADTDHRHCCYWCVSVYFILFSFSSGECMCFSCVPWTMVTKLFSFPFRWNYNIVCTIVNHSWIHLMSMNTVYVFSRRIREAKNIWAEGTLYDDDDNNNKNKNKNEYACSTLKSQQSQVLVLMTMPWYVFSYRKHVTVIIVLLVISLFRSLSLSYYPFLFFSFTPK